MLHNGESVKDSTRPAESAWIRPGLRTRHGLTLRRRGAPTWAECSGFDPARGFGMVLLLGVGVVQTGEIAPQWRECQGLDPARGPGMVVLLGVGGVFENGKRAPK